MKTKILLVSLLLCASAYGTDYVRVGLYPVLPPIQPAPDTGAPPPTPTIPAPIEQALVKFAADLSRLASMAELQADLIARGNPNNSLTGRATALRQAANMAIDLAAQYQSAPSSSGVKSVKK